MATGASGLIRRPRGPLRIARLAMISGIAKGPGFLIPVIIAAAFGAGHLTDAYFLAYGGVLLVGGTVGQPLEAVIVPFAAHAQALGRLAADRFMRSLFWKGLFTGGGSALLGALLIAGALRISPPAGVSATQVFGYYLLLAPAAVAWCIAGLYSGSLVSGWHLEVGAVAYGFRGVGALGGAVVGIVIRQLWPVAVGVSLGEWGRVVWLRFRWARAIQALPDGVLGKPEQGLLGSAASQMVAQGTISGAQFVERFLVGTVAVAAISHVEYANRLVMVAAVLFDGGVAPWLLARWSNVRVRSSLRSDWQSVYRPLVFAMCAAAGVALLMFIAAPLIVAVVLHHGAFTAQDSAMVTRLLQFYAVGYFFNMCTLCVERLLLARMQNRLFAILCAGRSIIRVGTVVAFLGGVGVLALPLGYMTAEIAYLAALLIASRLESPFRVHLQSV